MNATTSAADLPDHVSRIAASVVGIPHRRHSGTGVAWRDGVVVTSASALQRHAHPTVILPSGEGVDGELRGFDADTDLAAVQLPAGALPVAEPAQEPHARVGDFVFAVSRDDSGLTQASFGHVGAVGGEWRTWRGGHIDRLVRLDGGLYPGYAGAAVAGSGGGVIGLASAAFSRVYGIVIPAATVNRVLDELLAHGRVQRGYLGIAAQPVQAVLDGEATQGLLLSSVAGQGPAAQAGLQVGDVIVNIDGMPIQSLDALRNALRVGALASLVVSRGGQRREFSLAIVERPEHRC